MSFDLSQFGPAKLYENYTFTSRDAAESGKQQFKARIRRNLIASEIADLERKDEVRDEAGEIVEPAKLLLREFWDDVAPHVVWWNFKALNQMTGELEDVPPPSEYGGEIFSLVPPRIFNDIYNRLIGGPVKALELNAKN